MSDHIEREALADLLEAWAGRDLGKAADAILASGWLAGVKAQAVAASAPLVRRAILDPGSFVKRGPDYDGEPYGERLDQWQERAIAAALLTA